MISFKHALNHGVVCSFSSFCVNLIFCLLSVMVLFASQAFQRQVQECLTQLELINKQYRRLARENRTDSSCHLRQMVHDGNRRWDVLQRRVAAILRRLKVILSVISYTLPFKSLVSVRFFFKEKKKKNIQHGHIKFIK